MMNGNVNKKVAMEVVGCGGVGEAAASIRRRLSAQT